MSDKYKIYEELKEELGNNYDLFMYEINLCLLQKIDKAIEILKDTNVNDNSVLLLTTIDYARHILGDKENDIEFDVLKALNTDLDDDVKMG